VRSDQPQSLFFVLCRSPDRLGVREGVSEPYIVGITGGKLLEDE